MPLSQSSYYWHPSLTCPLCGGELFWDDYFKRWVCASWLEMEGGCEWQEAPAFRQPPEEKKEG